MQVRRLMPLFGLVVIMLSILLLLGSTSRSVTVAQQDAAIWLDGFQRGVAVRGERRIVPEQYRTVTADLPALEALLAQAPHELTTLARGSELILTLPLPNGTNGRFRIVEAPIMAPELAAKYPTIKSYSGRGIDHPTATARLSYTSMGLHGMIMGLPNQSTVFIDPYTAQSPDFYISYYRDAYQRDVPDIVEQVWGVAQPLPVLFGGSFSTGAQLRTFRLALATTGEYAQFHWAEQGMSGDVKTAAVNAINVAMTRVNGIYERELAVRMELVANNDSVVFTDEATDGYTNSSGGAMLGQNQTILDSVIGSPNYDIGHVFSTGGGGVAYLASLCDVNDKAGGVTGLPSPINDVFYVDYVAHELGHQFGAPHIFNSVVGSCGGGNRTASTAFEPGSGTTIMGYAGICGSQNIQSNSDDYFNVGSFDAMAAVVASASCGTVTSLGNVPPVVDAGNSYVIPVDTAFELTGSATDADMDDLTYAWEQHDLGPAGNANNPTGNAPLFRSFSPVSAGSRLFPQLSDLVNNSQTLGETLPDYDRNMLFRLTARDGNGGVAYDEMSIQVVDNGGAFAVTSPNTAVSYSVNTPLTVTWNVAGTDQAPISCANVDISLSDDNGATFDLLLGNTPNDGSQMVTPTLVTDEARIRVACSDNIFFDWSNVPFEITGTGVNHEADETAVSPGDTVTLTTIFTNSSASAVNVSATRSFAAPLLNGSCDDGLSVSLSVPAGQTRTFPCTATADPAVGLQISAQQVGEDAAGGVVSYTVTISNPTTYSFANVTLSNSGDASCLPATVSFAASEVKSYACDMALMGETTLTFGAIGTLETVNSITAVVAGQNQDVSETIQINFTTSESLTLTPPALPNEETLFLPFVLR